MVPDHLVDLGGLAQMMLMTPCTRLAFWERSGDSGEPVGDYGASRRPRRMTGPGRHNLHAGFRQNPIKALQIARKAVFRFPGFAQQCKDSFSFLFGAISKVGSAHRRQDPVHWRTDLSCIKKVENGVRTRLDSRISMWSPAGTMRSEGHDIFRQSRSRTGAAASATRS